MEDITLLTVDEVAQRLNRPVTTVKYWLQTGEGPKSFKLGRRRMFRASVVEAWLEEQIAKSDELEAAKSA